MPYHGHWHKEYPYVCDEVRYVGEICECDHGQAFSSHIGVPVCIEWPTRQKQCDCYANAPCDNKDGSCDDYGAEYGMDEDTEVKGKNAELHRHKGKIVEMAEDVVALPYHHLVVWANGNDVPSHAMRRSCCC